jgi:adenosylcobinamide amidohydrolase
MEPVVKLEEGRLWVKARALALSSTVDGGVREVEGAVFVQLRGYKTCAEMEKEAVPGHLTFYTAVDVARRHAVLRGERVLVAATAGLPNTINVLAVLAVEPDLRALADAFRLAVEAKAAAADLGLRRGGGGWAETCQTPLPPSRWAARGGGTWALGLRWATSCSGLCTTQ